MRILIAEDDLTARTILTGVLKKMGYEVTAVKDGKAAWDILQQADSPRLVILDWMMPVMDGLEVIQKVRALNKDQPPYIVLLTGKNDTTDIIVGLEAGANDYVKKPFDNEELFARLRVGQRMIELQRNLAEVHKMQSMTTMAAGVAHEINSPLQVVIWILDRLLNHKLVLENPDIYRDIQTASRSSWRIAQITRALLTYIQAIPMNKTRLNFNEIITRSLSSPDSNPPSAISLRLDLAPDMPDFTCDFEAFQKVVASLLDNAFDAMADGGEIMISTARDKENEKLMLYITDTGKTGIPEEIQEHIFDPFFTTKPPGERKGMGLSIVRGIVKAHHGEISFTTIPGKGTTFTLVFPENNSDNPSSLFI